MAKKRIGERVLDLTDRSLAKLEVWLAEIDTKDSVDIDGMTAFLTAIKRAAEIAKLADVLGPQKDDEKHFMDPETIRRLLSEEE